MTTSTLAAAPAVAPVELDFDARLALRDAEMTVRLESAGARLAVDACAAETVVDLVDVVGVPAELPAPARHSTPVAALLHRAHVRVTDGGWCRDAARTSGGMCLAEVIRVEARSHQEEGEARLLLRRALGGGDSIPEQNRRLASAGHAAQVLATAAATAAQQGL